MTDILAALAATGTAINDQLDRLLLAVDGPEGRLNEAMRYATLDGGKRLRPFLVLQTCRLFDVAEAAALRAAAAIEMVHCYSLVHDDLPAMDDDDLRRGRPTCHKAYDEATAILAGDALLTKAFEILATPATHVDPAVRCELVRELALASGDQGMIAGQMIDLLAAEQTMDIDAIIRLQNLKTGRLIGFSCEAGPIMGKALLPLREALRAYARDLGLAFQITDDLLDVEGDAEVVGKGVQKDAAAGKATFVSVRGVASARSEADILSRRAISHLACFDEKADLLRETARFVVQRGH